MKHNRTTHGMSKTRTYKIWCGMRSRCLNKNATKYYHYGAKGIKICDEWLRFENFYEDMGEVPSKTHSIDRINPLGNYEKDNCRWATFAQQGGENKTGLLLFTIDGKTMNLSAWERELGYKKGTLMGRLKRGISFKEAIARGLPKDNKYAGIRNKGEGRKKPWGAYIGRNNKQVFIGYFHTKDEALKARNEYLLKNDLFPKSQER